MTETHEAQQHRKQADQLPDGDIVAVLLRQHADILDAVERVKSARGTNRATAWTALADYLKAHETAEQQVVRPVVESAGDGAAEAQQRNGEEQQADAKVAELTALGVDSQEFGARFAELAEAVMQHAEHEEHEEFPRFDGVDADQRVRLGSDFLDAFRLFAAVSTRGQVVVVTGASGGIGRAVARAFARRGASVALLARGEAGLDAAARDVEAAGGRALALPTDVADPGQVESAAEATEKELGPIDVWVNVAFSSVFAPFAEIEPDEFRRVTEVTYLGYVYGTRSALARMRPRDSGVVVQVGSALAYRGIPLQSAYCGAKHAIQGFNESLRCELLHDRSRVRVTMVQMPAVNTPQFSWVRSRLPRRPQPVPPIYQPEVAAQAVLYAADHPRRREYWVGGSTVGTLLANAVAPGLLDRYLARTGYGAQQTDEPQRGQERGNLWGPADRRADFGAHGRFDKQASTRSLQVWASQHHGLLLGGAVAALASVGALRRRRS